MKTYEALNILEFIKSDKAKKMKANTDKEFAFLWALKKNKSKLEEIEKVFNEMKKDIDDSYNDDAHSIDEGEGKRKVKEKFLNEYRSKIEKLFYMENKVEFEKAKKEYLYNMGLTFEDLDILSCMIEE